MLVEPLPWCSPSPLFRVHLGSLLEICSVSITSTSSWLQLRHRGGSRDRAFSADTGMAETLIVATKHGPEVERDADALFLNLLQRPASLLEAAKVAKLATRLPMSSAAGHIRAGNQELGSYIRAPLNEGGCAALRESGLADAMIALRGGELRLPQYRVHHSIPITVLGELEFVRLSLGRNCGARSGDGVSLTPRLPRDAHPRRCFPAARGQARTPTRRERSSRRTRCQRSCRSCQINSERDIAH